MNLAPVRVEHADGEGAGRPRRSVAHPLPLPADPPQKLVAVDLAGGEICGGRPHQLLIEDHARRARRVRRGEPRPGAKRLWRRPRQAEARRMRARGKTSDEIAAQLGKIVSTIREVLRGTASRSAFP